MSLVKIVPSELWDLADLGIEQRSGLLDVLEGGGVLHLPALGLAGMARFASLLDPRYSDPRRKNISYSPVTGQVSAVQGDAVVQAGIRELTALFHGCAMQLVQALAPEYQGALRLAPASLRLGRIGGPAKSWRKDDSRLHMDAFPSRPNHGERILRVFTNINPHGEPRVWRVGEPFEVAVQRFLPGLPRYSRWQAKLLRALRVTKSLRSEYDHLMLHLHDAMKADMTYQSQAPQQSVAFAPGSSWVCFSDHALHAVMSGQFMLEQTLHLPVSAMRQPQASPLRILERLQQRALV